MILWILLLCSTLWAKDLSLLTLNLHGYHPMNQERRIIQYPNGKKELGWSHLHYFKLEEIQRGLNERQAALAQHLRQSALDLIFLQEVGGGYIDRQKNCQDFFRNNTALDLKVRLPSYALWVSCRGNIGWWTDPGTFKNFSVLSERSRQTVMTAGDNPYPQGLIMEGLAILSGPRIAVKEHIQDKIVINAENEYFFMQLVKFSLRDRKDGSWWIAVNIHGGHKIQNFEQAVATRRFLSRYLARQSSRDLFKGFIIAGDFNALEPKKEVSTIPWSFAHAWQTHEGVSTELLRLNRSDYKPFATLEEGRAQARVRKSVDALFDWFSWRRLPQDGSLKEVSLVSTCRTSWSLMNPFCQFQDKIDHIFVSEGIKVKNYSGLYKQNNWTDLSGTTSDHPGLITTIESN